MCRLRVIEENTGTLEDIRFIMSDQIMMYDILSEGKRNYSIMDWGFFFFFFFSARYLGFCIFGDILGLNEGCLLYTSPSPRDKRQSRMPSSA